MTATALPLWIGGVSLVLAVFLRALPRVLWPNYQGTDAYYHLAYIRLIRDTGHRLPRGNPRISGPGEHAYPALFHWLLSYFTARAVRWVDRFGGVLGDLLVAVGVSGVLFSSGTIDPGAALVAAALYLLLPGLVLPHIGPRAFTLTPRLWGQVFYALAILCWLVADSYPQAWLLSVVPLAPMLLTSKFAMQNIIFVAPIAALLMGRLEPLAVAIGAAALALILFRGMFVRQLVGQVGHLRWYLRRNLEMIAGRGNWSALASAVAAGDIRQLAVEAIWQNPIVSGLLRHFPIVVALLLVLRNGTGGVVGDIALAVTLAALVPWILTAFGRMRVLGESERYLEFAAPAALVLLWTAQIGGHLLFALVAAAFLSYVATLVFMARTGTLLGNKDLDDLVPHLTNDGTTLLCLHDPESYYFLANTGVRLMKYNGDLTAFGDAGRFIERFFWRYPYVDPRALKDLIEEGGVDFILENRRGRARLVALSGLDYDLGGLNEVGRNDSYALYSVGSAG